MQINKKVILIIVIFSLGFVLIAWLLISAGTNTSLQTKLNLYGDPKKEVKSAEIVYHDESGNPVSVKNIFPKNYDPEATPIFDIAYEPNKYYIYYEAMGDNFVIRLQINQPDIKQVREEAENILIKALNIKDRMDLCKLPVSTYLASDIKYLGPKSSSSDFGISYCPGDYNID